MEESAPGWMRWAKYAGEYDYHASGGREFGCLMYAIHFRSGAVVGDPLLGDEVVVSMKAQLSTLAESEEWKKVDKMGASAEKRIVRKPLGLLQRFVAFPDRVELVFRCADGHAGVAALQGLRKKWPEVEISTRSDPTWEGAAEHARAFGMESMYQNLVQLGRDGRIQEGTDDDGHPALRSVRSFRTWVKEHPPRCLTGLHIQWVSGPVKKINQIGVAFDLGAAGMGEAFALYSHPSGQSTDPGSECVGPVHILRQGAGPGTEPSLLFDTAVHGYHGELGHSAHRRGEGLGTRRCCEKCKGEWFHIRITFDYHQVDDLADEAPDFPVQDYFVGIIVTGSCAGCGKRATLFYAGEL